MSTCIFLGLGAVSEAASIELSVYEYIALNVRRSRASKKGNTPSSAISKEKDSKDTQDSEPAALWSQGPAARIDSSTV